VVTNVDASVGGQSWPMESRAMIFHPERQVSRKYRMRNSSRQLPIRTAKFDISWRLLLEGEKKHDDGI
jgi:uncharacterized membrane protein YfbV (UPF0208 family)